LKALVVGLGNIGMGYDLDLSPEEYIITHASAFQSHPQFELVGGVDKNQQNCDVFSEHYCRPAFTELKKALVSTKPDIIAIALPTELHSDAIEIVFKNLSPSIILCEKPLSYNLSDAKKIVSLCELNNCSLYVNYMRRSDPASIEVLKRIKNNDLNTPLKGVVWYSKGLFNNGSHFFNLLQSWLGEMDDYKIINSGRLWDGIDPEPDFQVTFDNSEITFLSAKEENFSHYTIELVAENGRLRIDQGGQKVVWQFSDDDKVAKRYTILSDEEEIIHSDMQRSQWNVAEQIAHLSSGEESYLCTGIDAILTLEALENIRASLNVK